jgi:N-acetylglucosaminyldiphosphoundecaprenol N-acetyl-beta-D-mannosaminyltransferase
MTSHTNNPIDNDLLNTDVLPIKGLENTNICILGFKDQCSKIFNHILHNPQGYVCVANVHMIIEALNDKKFLQVLNKSTFIVPDGVPLVWLLRRKNKKIERVAGYDLCIDLCSKAEKNNLSVIFYGSTNEVLAKIKKNILLKFPDLNIAGMISPPFGEVSDKKLIEINSKIQKLNPNIIFVALGCPKQEIWMHNQFKKFNSLMIGVGGAFPLLAGEQSRAPSFIRRSGFEWLYRLILEPRRLWKRYMVTNTKFIIELLRSIYHNVVEKLGKDKEKI